MQSVRVRTSQNVYIDYNIASVGDRILAELIDTVIVIAYVFAALYVVGDQAMANLSISVPVLIPVFTYHLLCEVFMGGQTIGKKQLKIKVVKVDGSRPGIGGFLVRWIFRIIDIYTFYGGVAILVVVLTKNGQRVGDLVAGTTVIKLKQQHLTSNPTLQDFQDEYQPVFPEVFRLTDREIDLIDKALEFNLAEGNPGPAELLAKKLADKMGSRHEMPPIKFLHTVKKDYLHITSQ